MSGCSYSARHSSVRLGWMRRSRSRRSWQQSVRFAPIPLPSDSIVHRRMRPESRPLSTPRPSATLTSSSQPYKGRDPRAESARRLLGKEASNPRCKIERRRFDAAQMDTFLMDTLQNGYQANGYPGDGHYATKPLGAMNWAD